MDQKEAQVHCAQNQTAGTNPTVFLAAPTPTTIPTAARTNLGIVLDVHVSLANVRIGPGTNYEIIGRVQAGDRLNDIVEESGGCYKFCCVDGYTPGWLHSSLVTTPQIGAPPSHLNTDPFYQKYLDAGGVPILAPGQSRTRSYCERKPSR